MAKVRIELVELTRVRDLMRFIELLDLVGVNVDDGSHPISMELHRGSIGCQIDSNALVLPSDVAEEDL